MQMVHILLLRIHSFLMLNVCTNEAEDKINKTNLNKMFFRDN